MKSKINLVSLGCPRNLVDSEAIISRLMDKGASIVKIDKADAVIINTCAFIKEAKEESIEIILDAIELKKKGLVKKVLVFGCLSQRYSKELPKEFKEVDAFMGRLDLDHAENTICLTPSYYAYLKICEGCFNNCSFCVIPKIKGEFKSRSKKDILDRACFLDDKKISELNIIGQDITCFGLDSNSSLTGLILEILKKTTNIKWIRLLYLNPLRLDDALIELIKIDKRLCKYIDLPIQHINNRILKLMNRQITKDQIISVIKRIRDAIPGVTIRTSVIVGFPAETEEEFKELLDFIKQVKFERLGAFIYSQEEDTAAYNFSGQIPERVKQKRFDILMQAQREIAEEVNQSLLGKAINVLIEEYRENHSVKGKNNVYVGRSQADAPEVDGSVVVKSKEKLTPGDIVKVKISETYEYDLVGERTAA